MNRLYINRQIEPQILEAASQFPVVVITGPRQSGKSTLLHYLFEDHNYLTFDDPMLRRSCLEDPALFLETLRVPVILDEIQYVPEILPHIKMAVDKNRHLTGQYLLTGSQAFPLIKGLTESLAGRAAVFELYSFNLPEYREGEKSITDLFNRIFNGTYPDTLIHKVNRSFFYSSYLQTYLERDIRQVQNIADLSLFQHFLELLAGRAAKLINFSEIARDLGVSSTTVKRWISLLENFRIIYLLRPFYKNLDKRIIKSPKVYFPDPGILCYLLKYPDPATLISGPAGGSVLENFIISEVLKSKYNLNRGFEIYFYRDSNYNEIDLVLDYGYRQILAEVKLNKNIQTKHVSSLLKIQHLFANPALYVISAYERELSLPGGVNNLPAWEIEKLTSL